MNLSRFFPKKIGLLLWTVSHFLVSFHHVRGIPHIIKILTLSFYDVIPDLTLRSYSWAFIFFYLKVLPIKPWLHPLEFVFFCRPKFVCSCYTCLTFGQKMRSILHVEMCYHTLSQLTATKNGACLIIQTRKLEKESVFSELEQAIRYGIAPSLVHNQHTLVLYSALNPCYSITST